MGFVWKRADQLTGGFEIQQFDSSRVSFAYCGTATSAGCMGAKVAYFEYSEDRDAFVLEAFEGFACNEYMQVQADTKTLIRTMNYDERPVCPLIGVFPVEYTRE